MEIALKKKKKERKKRKRGKIGSRFEEREELLSKSNMKEKWNIHKRGKKGIDRGT